MGFLARECGWDKDFVAEKFTVEQVRRYVEVLNQQRNDDYKTQTYCFFMGSAYAFGSIKSDKFKDFISQFDGKSPKIEETMKKMREMNLPIEDQ